MAEWPIRYSREQLQKSSRTAGRVKKFEDGAAAAKKERDAKSEVRKRDKYCRFPLCGCRKFKVAIEARPEVSHEKHKGMGGNPAGDRSVPELLVYLCKHRHQDAPISRHKGTLRARFLTRRLYNGTIAWEIDVNRMSPNYGARPQKWITIAKETSIQEWTYTPEGRALLEQLAEMQL